MIRKIFNFFKYIYETTQLGFYYICLVLSKGFFFYFYCLFYLFEKIFHLKLFGNIKAFFKKIQNEPLYFLILVFICTSFIFYQNYLYVDNNDITYVDNNIVDNEQVDNSKQENTTSEEPSRDPNGGYSSNETNLYRKYGKYDVNNLNFNELRETNSDVVAWITVDGTNVNYPVVQTADNDYYLKHDILKNYRSSGWVFMDFRNELDLSDDNTIFYGHNLLNRTSFGSLQTLFTDKWFNNSNHYIVIATPDIKNVYEVFSVYTIDPEVYYLQNNFYTEEEYQKFLDTLKSRSKYNFNVDLNINDRIITLSTCTDDNLGRKVIHAKLIK